MPIKKIILLNCLLLLTILIILGIIKFNRIGYTFMYVSPNTNTNVFPYISRVTKTTNTSILKALNRTKKDYPQIKLKYTSGYGSGFLKDNNTSSDYDYSANIYLGEFIYTGNNEEEIAKQLIDVVSKLHYNLYLEFLAHHNNHFYIQPLASKRLPAILIGKEDETKDFIINSLKEIVQNKSYHINFGKRYFNLKNNQLLLPNSNFVKLFSDEISYSKDYRKFLRELSISLSYNFTLNNTQTHEKKLIQLMPEMFAGNTTFDPDLQPFVPYIYTSPISYFTIQKNILFMSNETYLRLLLENYAQHYKSTKYILTGGVYSPLKIVKRILQRTYIIEPILSKEKIQQIRDYNTLQNNNIILLNDYSILLDIMASFCKSSDFAKESENDIKQTLNKLNILIDEMRTNQFAEKDLTPLVDFNKEIENLYNTNKTINAQKFIKFNTNKIQQHIDSLMSAEIKNKKEYIECSDYMNQILESAGFHIVKLYISDDENESIKIFRSDYTNNININDLYKMEMYGEHYIKLPDSSTTKYEYTDETHFKDSDFNIMYYLVRNNPTEKQIKIWDEYKQKLLKEKHHYYLHINFGLIK